MSIFNGKTISYAVAFTRQIKLCFTNLAKRFILLFPMLVVSVSANAQVLEADKARYAINLFASICIFGQGKPESPSDAVEFRLRPLVMEAQSFFLNGQPGKAYGSDVAFGSFVLALLDNGECLVHVRRLASSQALQLFQASIKLLGKSSSVESMPTFKGARAFGEVSIVQYFFYGQSNSVPYEVELATTDFPEALVQATFSSKIRK